MTLMIATHSPYIINHLNLLILAAEKNELVQGAAIKYDDIGAYQVTDGYICNLKQKVKKILDTRDLSEPIDNIYVAYEALERK